MAQLNLNVESVEELATPLTEEELAGIESWLAAKALAIEAFVPHKGFKFLKSIKSWLYNHDMHAIVRVIKRAERFLKGGV
jgi:hypothetical protein